jgi:hypothetical protein
VKDCDLVIRFGGEPSLIQLIQSKGRARASTGRLVVICTVEERTHFDELRDREKLVDDTLGNATALAQIPTPRFTEFVRVNTEQLHERAASDPRERDPDESGDEDDGASSPQRSTTESGIDAMERDAQQGLVGYPLTLIVCNAGQLGDAETRLQQALRSVAGLVDSVDQCTYRSKGARQAVTDHRAVTDADALAIVSMRSMNHNFWWQFCATWEFQLRKEVVFILSPPAPAKRAGSEEGATARSVSTITEVLGVTAGHLVGPQQFLPMGHLGSADSGHRYDKLVLHHGKRLRLESSSSAAYGKGSCVSIVLSTAILGRSVLACADSASKTFTVYFTSTSVPAMYQYPASQQPNMGQGMSQYRVYSTEGLVTADSGADSVQTPAQQDLRLLAHCPVIAVTLNAIRWKRVLRKLSDPAVLGLNVLITRVAQVAAPAAASAPISGADAPQAVVPFPVSSDGGPSPASAHIAAQRQCWWAFATLAADVHTLSLNPVAVAHIRTEVLRALQSGTVDDTVACTKAVQSLHSLLQRGSHWIDAAALFETLLRRTKGTTASAAAITVRNASASESEIVVAGTTDTSLDPSEYVFINRVMVTPSRVLVQPATLTKTNRLIRMFGAQYNLVYAKFRDEQGQAIYADQIYEHRYRRMFADGITIAGRHYEFLLCSASQLREQTGVFLEGTAADVRGIRNTLISADLGSIPKQLSRMGLFCTADSDTRVKLISGDNILKEADAYTTAGKRILTDGSGRMTPAFARKVQRDFYQQNGYYGTLIQIRALGCKGTLLCDPHLENTHPDKDVVFRESMWKFDTDCHDTMCVVKVAEYCPLTLNRESINLLCAIRDHDRVSERRWSPHNTLVALQDEALEELGEMLVNPTHAVTRLGEVYPSKILQELMDAGVNVLTEPHFMALLHLMYFHDARRLRQKTHIPVMHAALAMGAPDPTGLLNDGEVFLCVHRAKHGYAGCFDSEGKYKLGDGITLVRISDAAVTSGEGSEVNDETVGEGYETFVVTGKILIHRNPCLDPGDVRLVTAVDHPRLRYWKNVLLLPASTTCERSLSAECSGGDLDGDTFSTIWHPHLIPPDESQFEAVDYEAVQAAAKKQMAPPGTDVTTLNDTDRGQYEREEIAKFIARTMCNASLGRIAHLHLALCDQLTKIGAGHSLSREVAKAQSLAVDYPKTGVPPVVPAEAKRLVRQKGFPHFMEKRDRLQYDSVDTLGTLYNISSTVTCMAEFTGRGGHSYADPLFAHPDQEAYRDDAEAAYAAFEREMQSLMLQYKLTSEVEVVLGLPYQWSDEFAVDHASAADSLRASWKRLCKKYRDMFYGSLQVAVPDGKLSKAAAWYHTAYAKKDRTQSFAWLVLEELVEVRKHSAAAALSIADAVWTVGHWDVHDSIAQTIGASVKRQWQLNADLLSSAVMHKRLIFNRVKDAILNSKELAMTGIGEAVRVELYGSASLLLCEAHSDVDISVSAPGLRADYVLPDIVVPAIGAVAESVKYISQAAVPLVKAQVDNGYCLTDVDITVQNSDGVYKSRLIRYLYALSGAHTVLFSAVVQWARCCGLLRENASKQQGLLNSGQVQALVVSFLFASNAAVAPSADVLAGDVNQDTDAALLSSAGKCSELEVGRLLLQFFAHYRLPVLPSDMVGSTSASSTAVPEVAFRYTWPVPGEPQHVFDASSLNELHECCRRALHVLAVSRDWKYLLEHAKAFELSRTRVEQLLSSQLSSTIKYSYPFIAATLQIESKAQVIIAPSPADSTRLLLTATGKHQQILALRRALARLIYHGRLVSYGAIRSLSSTYFLENSSMIYARGAETRASMLSVQPIHVDRGFVRTLHQFTEVSAPCMDSAYHCAEHVWRDAFKAELRDKVQQQVAQIARLRKGERLQFSVHLGKFLLLDAGRSFERGRGNVSCAEIETAMNNNHGNAKFDLYGRSEGIDDGGTKPQPSQKPQQGKGGQGSSAKTIGVAQPVAVKHKKKSLATTFISSVPLGQPVSGSDSATAAALTVLSDVAASTKQTEQKLAAVLSTLGYAEYTLPVHNGADSTDSLPVPHSHTLQIPTNTWRVAVEVSNSSQVHVDLDEQGKVLGAEDRLLSWVNGTLVSAAPPPKSDDQAQSSLTYDFRDHDLRLKIGATQPISEELHSKVCPGGSAPVEFSPLTGPQLSTDVSVTSVLPTALRSSHQQAMDTHVDTLGTPVLVRPSQDLPTAYTISFARKVTQRRAFLCPTLASVVNATGAAAAPEESAVVPTTAEEEPVDRNPSNPPDATTSKSANGELGDAAIPIVAMVATGQHYDGAHLDAVTSFVDLSLEIDVSPLVQLINSTSTLLNDDNEVAEGAEDTANSGDLTSSGRAGAFRDNAVLGAYCDTVVTEVLRVSDAFRQRWGSTD